MLRPSDLKDYRLMRGLSQRDVAMYCDLSHNLIGDIELGQRNLTEYNYQEIVKGINAASQAKARGTFEADKKKFMEKENAYENQRQKDKAAERKAEAEKKAATTTKRKSTKPTASKTVKADTK